MMKRYGLMVLCLIWAELFAAYAQNTYNFPQVANGAFPGGSFKTTMILANSGNLAANVTVTLTKDDGSPFPIFSELGPSPINLPPGNSRAYQSDGVGALSAGAAMITSDNPVGATLIFSRFDSDGNLLTEAGVGNAPAANSFTIPVDLSGGFDTGVAFFKPGSGSATIALTLKDQNGASQGTAAPITVAANNHTAKYVTELFTGLSGFTRGSLTITSTANVAAVALRLLNGPIPVITTLPVAAAATTFSFPQVGNGSFPNGSLKTTLILINSGTAAADVNVRLTQDNGSAFAMSIFPGLESGRVTLAPGNTRVYQSDGAGGLVAGAAYVTSNNPIVAAVIFSQLDAGGRLVTEAGVSNAPAMNAFTIPVDLRNPFNTGVALFKQGAGNATVSLRLHDLAATPQGSDQTVSLVGDGHRAAYVLGELFPDLTGLAQGTLSVTSTADVAAVALRLGAGVGPVLTTLPVIPGAYRDSGLPPPPLAGSYEGRFTPDGTTSGAGTLTFVLRADGSTISGRIAQEFNANGCIRVSEFTNVSATPSGFSAVARALDGSNVNTTLNVTSISSGGDLSGTFSTRGCVTGSPMVNGQFTLSKRPGTCPPQGPFNFLGGAWDPEEEDRATISRLQGSLDGNRFNVTNVTISGSGGAGSGAGMGMLNSQCDRVENLVINLNFMGSTIRVQGEVSITSDGKIIFGALQFLDPSVSLTVSTLARQP